MKIDITMDMEQANALLNLIDTAVRADGLRSAANGLFFSKLLQDAVKSASTHGPAGVEGGPN